MTHDNEALETKFVAGIEGGTMGKFLRDEDHEKMIENFFNGNGADLFFGTNSSLSKEVRTDSRFKASAQSFETQLLNYLQNNGSLAGFNGNSELTTVDLGGIRANMYLATMVGGTQGVSARVTVHGSNKIEVKYYIYDTFGAGDNDATRPLLPGLQSMYVLQHYRGTGTTKYKPFIWSVQVTRRNGIGWLGL